MGNTAAAWKYHKKGAWGAEEIYELLLSSYLWVGQTYPEAKGRQMVGNIVPLIQSRVGNGQRMDQRVSR